MAQFEQKPGSGAIFKNDKKTLETHPDYRGKIKTPDNKEWELSLWVKKTDKGSFFSVSVKEPYNQAKAITNLVEPENDLPF